MVPHTWCLQGCSPAFPGFQAVKNGFGGPDENCSFPADDSPSSAAHRRGCCRPGARPGSLSHFGVLPEGSTLTLPYLSNKQFNHSLLAIKILSWSHLVDLCKKNLTSIKFCLRLVDLSKWKLSSLAPSAPVGEHRCCAPLEAQAGVSQGLPRPPLVKAMISASAGIGVRP